MKISVNSKITLNGVGLAGALMFVGGPFFAALNYITLIRRISMGRLSAPEDFALTVAICVAISLIGFVMLLIGREYDHTVVIDREKQ